MNILAIARYFHPPVGGAEVSLATLTEELAKEHTVSVLCYGTNDGYASHGNVSVHFRNLLINRNRSYAKSLLNSARWGKAVKQEIEKEKPDLVLTQLVLSPMAVMASRRLGTPSIVLLRSYEPFCPISFVNGTDCDNRCFECFGTHRERAKHLFLRSELKHYEFSLRKADLVISNSEFMRDILYRWYGIPSAVVPPFIRLTDYLRHSDSSRDHITFIGSSSIKGIHIFLEIAKALRTRKFLLVGTPESELVKKELGLLSNVEQVARTADMSKVYERTRLLLVPSVWPEPFGRVCVEAMANRIPCIVSNRGGLPEVTGDVGVRISNVHNIDDWLDAISRFDNQQLYEELSTKCEYQSKKFDLQVSYRRFLDCIATISK